MRRRLGMVEYLGNSLFYYGYSTRHDMRCDLALADLAIRVNANLLQTFDFNWRDAGDGAIDSYGADRRSYSRGHSG